MNATERAALLRGLELQEEMHSVVGERTVEILEHRRRTGIVKRRGWLVRRVLAAADVCGILAALLIAELVVTPHTSSNIVDARHELALVIGTLPLWVVVAKVYGLYDRDEERTDHSTTDDFVGIFHMITVCTFLLWAVSSLTHVVQPRTAKLLLFWAVAISLVATGRAIARAIARRHVAYIQNAVIVGAGDVGQLVAKKVLNHPEYGINVVGFVDSRPKERREDLERVALLGGPEHLRAVVRMFDVERVIFAYSNDGHDEMLEQIRSVNDLDVQIDIVPRFYELVGPGVGIHSVEGLSLFGLPPLRLARSSRLLKRTMDIVLSIAGFLILIPFFALVALAIKVDSRGPVFFRQVRMGSGDRTFRIWKFRTMVNDADSRKHEVAHLNQHLRRGGDARMFKIPNDPRVTRVGRLLRWTSLDELPQLLNVVTGDMSLVGPRPLILEEDSFVESWGRRRLDLKPGITGLWQVLGGSSISFEEMVRLDYLYVTTWSLSSDATLLIKTIPRIARGSRG